MTSLEGNALNFSAAIQLCGGKEDLAREIIQMLVDELPKQNLLLQTAFEQHDWKQLDYLTHKLSGSAAYCGMEQIKKYSHIVNKTIREKDLPQVIIQLPLLQQAITSALAAAAALDIKPTGE